MSRIPPPKLEPGVPARVDVATARKYVRVAASVYVWTDFGFMQASKANTYRLFRKGRKLAIIVKHSVDYPGTYYFNGE